MGISTGTTLAVSRALMDFAKLVEVLDRNNVTFVSVTQSFNTTTSMGRLTLNILLSFAQYEREIIGERIRDKFAARLQAIKNRMATFADIENGIESQFRSTITCADCQCRQ